MIALTVVTGFALVGTTFAGAVAVDDGSIVAQQAPPGVDGNPDQNQAYLRVLHAVADAGPVDVSVNGETVATGVEFSNATDYVAVDSGPVQLEITDSGSGETVLSQEASLNPRIAATFTASGTLGENGDAGLQVTSTLDNALESGGNFSVLRFAHLSPDVPAVDIVRVDLSADNLTEVIYEDVAYGEVGDYLTVPEGDQTLQVRRADDGTTLFSTTFDLDDESAYTAYAIGLGNASGDEAPVQVTPIQDAIWEWQFPGVTGTVTEEETATPFEEEETETPSEDEETATPFEEEDTETPFGEEETATPFEEEEETETPFDEEETETPFDEEETETPFDEEEETEDEEEEEETETPTDDEDSEEEEEE
ncbi:MULTISPECIES: DUF4397 domain-containing protein [Salinibaculum]|uniref:DUF4397 domain-containing protein n=1 Tax=Salinibaculum TaxID=2732368 RepID=UPI0030D5A7B3